MESSIAAIAIVALAIAAIVLAVYWLLLPILVLGALKRIEAQLLRIDNATTYTAQSLERLSTWLDGRNVEVGSERMHAGK